VDTTQAVGYKDLYTYCAAPILAGAPGVVQYWAVGYECCKARGTMECDGVADPSARTGVRVPEVEPLLFSVGFVGTQFYEYKRAVKMAEWEYGLHSAPDALFVRWTAGADPLVNELWMKGLLLWGGGLVVFIVLCVFLLVIGTAGAPAPSK